VKSLSVLTSSAPRDFLGRSLSESLRNAPLKTYYTPWLCRIVQDQLPYHDSLLPYDFPKKKMIVTFLMISMLVFPLHLADLQVLRLY